jgi:hypothetical protein
MHVRADNEDTVKDSLKCRYENNIDKRIEMHNRINSMNHKRARRVRSSLSTHDYICKALEKNRQIDT